MTVSAGMHTADMSSITDILESTSPTSPTKGGFHTAAPISFDRSSFTGKTFSPERFLADRRHIALDELKGELQQALKDLKVELVELINLDFADFINLSTKLVGVDKMILNLREPLERVRSEAQVVRDSLNDTTTQLEDELDRRASIRERKACLQLFVSIHDSVEKLDALLHNSGETYEQTFDANDPSPTSRAPEDGKLIERVANEYTQLRYLTTRASGMPFVLQIEKRIARIRDTLTSSLSRSLTNAYGAIMANKADSAAEADLTQLLRTYVTIDKVDDALGIFRDSIAKPALEQITSRQNLTPNNASTSPNRSTSTPLQTMYNRIIAFAKDDCAKVLEITNRAFHGTSGNVLAQAIWTPALTMISKKIGFIFNPGIPEVFHKNYTTSMAFVAEMEKLCRTRRSLATLRALPATVEFMRRWQLPVYFQIRFREIATDFEECVSGSIDFESAFTANDGLVLPPSTALLVCTGLCWDKSVFLPRLAHRFWKLTLQIITRYSIWVRQSLLPELDISALPSNSETDKTPTSAIDQSNDSALRKFLYFHNDIRAIDIRLKDIFESEVQHQLHSLSPDTTILQDSLTASLNPLQSVLPFLSERVCKVLYRRCSDPLRNHIQSITPQYRMTNKEPPSRPSYFVPTILKPLSTFLDEQRHLLNATIIAEWTGVVLEQVTARYASTMAEVLSGVKRFEDYNRKKNLKRTNSGVGGGAGGGTEDSQISDDDKIRLQMALDVMQYGQEMQTLGQDPSSITSFGELSAMVTPFLSLKSAARPT
ncbi:hypothetical protein DFS34DRAFT_311057 [Phlyctochytrium arcticum]|nr:hypothetical protein DFS34DRAFT_311057 [Phlyctochytrium arcticum]